MKSIISFLCLCLLVSGLSFTTIAQDAAALQGAWKQQVPGSSVLKVAIFGGPYFVQTTYDPVKKQFIESLGGTYKSANNQLFVSLEFHTNDKSLVGESATLPLKLNGDELTTTDGYGHTETWQRIDNGQGALAGTWRITQRRQDGQMHSIPAGDRKTLKILSGTRFQWIAINSATGDFFGTGGGTYTFENGKYTENIQFFSRDSTRVGHSLSFDGEIKNGKWHHKGLSSKGAPIYEIWEKRQ